MLFIHLHPSHVVVLACLSCILLYSLSLVFVHVILCTKIVAHSVFVHAILAFVHVILAFVHVILAFVILPNRQLLICIFVIWTTTAIHQLLGFAIHRLCD